MHPRRSMCGQLHLQFTTVLGTTIYVPLKNTLHAGCRRIVPTGSSFVRGFLFGQPLFLFRKFSSSVRLRKSIRLLAMVMNLNCKPELISWYSETHWPSSKILEAPSYFIWDSGATICCVLSPSYPRWRCLQLLLWGLIRCGWWIHRPGFNSCAHAVTPAFYILVSGL